LGHAVNEDFIKAELRKTQREKARGIFPDEGDLPWFEGNCGSGKRTIPRRRLKWVTVNH